MMERQKEIEKEAFLRSDPEFFDEVYIDGFVDGAEWADKNVSKENIIKILKIYDNIFGLSDGGITKDEKDLEHAADVILKSLNTYGN